MGSKAVVDALPPPILALFSARPQMEFLKPPTKGKCRGYDGIASFMEDFENKEDTPPLAPPGETKDQRKERKQKERSIRHSVELNDAKEAWKPKEATTATEDAYKTLYVGRINYETTEARLKREFEAFGPIKSLVMIKDTTGKPRGSAFIEFERERDMRTAYKQADGKKIDGRRVLVDVERGRTVNGWLPRRLGGGLGGTRMGGKEVNQTYSGRATQSSSDKDRGSERGDDRGGRESRPERRDEERSSRRDREPRSDRGDRDKGDREKSDRDKRRDRSPRAERGSERDSDRRRDRSRDRGERDYRRDRGEERR